MHQKEFLSKVLPVKQKIYRLAKRLLVSNEEAEDAIQEVFIKMWNKKEDIATLNSVEAMMMTMTKNYCLDRLKSKQANHLNLANHRDPISDSKVDTINESQDRLRWVQKIIDSLPENQRIIIQLREIEEMEFDEIASIMQLTPENVRVILSRARKTIREQISKIDNYGIRVHQ